MNQHVIQLNNICLARFITDTILPSIIKIRKLYYESHYCFKLKVHFAFYFVKFVFCKKFNNNIRDVSDL